MENKLEADNSRAGINNKFTNLIKGSDGYKEYKRRFPKTKLTKNQYNSLLGVYFKNVREFLLEGGDYKIPRKLGIFKIIKVKDDLRSLKIDFKATRELWEEDEESRKEKRKV